MSLGARGAAGCIPKVIHTRWKPGPLAGMSGRVVVSATEFTYRRWRDMPLVWFHGLRLRRRWGELEGAIGLATAAEAFRPVTYTLSVWRAKEDLRRFLRSADHVELVRDFKRRQAGAASVVWEVEGFELRAAWRDGMRRLGEQKAQARRRAPTSVARG